MRDLGLVTFSPPPPPTLLLGLRHRNGNPLSPPPRLTSLNFQAAPASKPPPATRPSGRVAAPAEVRGAVGAASGRWEEQRAACRVRKEHFYCKRLQTRHCGQKRSRYIEIATHVPGNSTDKARWIKMSEIITVSLFKYHSKKIFFKNKVKTI